MAQIPDRLLCRQGNRPSEGWTWSSATQLASGVAHPSPNPKLLSKSHPVSCQIEPAPQALHSPGLTAPPHSSPSTVRCSRQAGVRLFYKTPAAGSWRKQPRANCGQPFAHSLAGSLFLNISKDSLLTPLLKRLPSKAPWL